MQSTLTMFEFDTSVLIDDENQYKLLMHNDNSTPIEFVVYILMTIFGFSSKKSIHLATKAHEEGRTIIKQGSKSELDMLKNEAMAEAKSMRFNDFRITMEAE